MLVNRVQFLSTQVLPVGLWTFGVSHGRWGQSSGSYNDAGVRVSNTEFFSRDVNYSALSDEISDPLERELARAAFDVYGRKDTEVAGRAVNDVDVSQSSNTYVLGRGLTKRSSLFLVFPVVTISTRIRSRFVAGPSLAGLTDELRSEGQYAQAQEIIDNTQRALEKRLSETGYSSNYPDQLTTLANVFLTHRYQVSSERRLALTADSSLVVPAGERSGVDDFLYLRVNEEQYSFRQALALSSELNRSVSVLVGGYYHLRFPFERSRRIPLNRTSPLSADIDRDTRMRYGDTWGGQAQLNLSLSESWLGYFGQTHEFKARDRVSGERFSSARYDGLEDGTEQRLVTSYAGVSVNSISAFLAQKFIIPMDLNVQYSLTHAGRNTFANQALAATLMVFYK